MNTEPATPMTDQPPSATLAFIALRVKADTGVDPMAHARV